MGNFTKLISNGFSSSILPPDTLAKDGAGLKKAWHIIQFIISFYVLASIVIGIALFNTDIDNFFWFTQEDGLVEYSTAFFLFAAFSVCVLRALIKKNKYHIAFYTLCSFVFFFGFGEEISWGQRIFQFDTPEELMLINEQKEFTFHNLNLYGISFKKVLFRLVLNTCVAVYFLGFPLLYRTNLWFSNLITKYGIPVPTPTQAVLFLFAFISIQLIDEGKKWELLELAIAGLTFLSFLFAWNSGSSLKLKGRNL